MNTNLLNNFNNRIIRVNFDSNIILSDKIKKLSDNEIQEFLKLDDINFKRYLSLYLKSKEYESKEILNLLFFNKKNPYLKQLFEIFFKTNILDSPALIDFTRFYFQLKNKEQVLLLHTILLRKQNIMVFDLTKLVYTILQTKTASQRNCLNIIYKYYNKITSKSFSKYLEVILNNPNSNLNYITKCIQVTNGEILSNNSNHYKLLSSFTTIEDKSQLELLYSVYTNKSIMESYVLSTTLKLINNYYFKIDYPFYIELINKKKLLSDTAYKILLEEIIFCSSKEQRVAILSLSNYSHIINDVELLNFSITYLKKVKDKTKLNTMLKIMENPISLKDENIIFILDAIVKASTISQVNTIYTSYKNLLVSDKRLELIEYILNEKRSYSQKYLSILLTSKYMERNDICEIIKRLLECEEEYQMKGIMTILEKDKIVTHSKYLELLTLLNINSIKKVKAIVELVYTSDIIFQDSNLDYIKLITNILEYQVDLIMIILLSKEKLSIDRTKSLIDMTLKCPKNQIKVLKDYILHELEIIEMMIKSENKIKKKHNK